MELQIIVFRTQAIVLEARVNLKTREFCKLYRKFP